MTVQPITGRSAVQQCLRVPLPNRLPGRASSQPKFCPHGKLEFWSLFIVVLINIASLRLSKEAGT